MNRLRGGGGPEPLAFDDLNPWGHWPPSGPTARLLALSHRVPPPFTPLVRLLRRHIKYGVHQPLDVVIWERRLRLMPRGNFSEQKLLVSPRLFDRRELAFLAGRLRPGDCFVDIGANAGIYSIWADRCMQGRGRVIAVEPDPEMRRRLAFNLATNAIHSIEVCPVALSDRRGTASLFVDPSQRGLNTLEASEAEREGGPRSGMVVDVVPLSSLLAERGVHEVRALKIDVEGHEATVLRHFFGTAPAGTLPGAIITEAKGDSAAGLEAMLGPFGYRRLARTELNLILTRD